MRRFKLASSAALALVFGLAALGFAQAPDQHNDNNNHQQAQHQPAQRQQAPSHAQAQRQPARPQAQPRRSQPAARNNAPARRAAPARNNVRQPARVQQPRSPAQIRGQQAQQRNVWNQRRAGGNLVARNWAQRGGYHGTRIPDAAFAAHFGPGHVFRAYQMPFMVVGGYPRLQYGGYWFSVVDPIPVWWGPDWYQNDNIYFAWVDGGYYMYNAAYPGRPGVAVSVSF